MHHLKNVGQKLMKLLLIMQAILILQSPMYNLIEYTNNYSDTSGSLWKFRRDEIEGGVDLTVDNSSSFKYKSSFIGNTDADGRNRKTEV